MRKLFLVFFVVAIVAGCADKNEELSDAEQLQKDIETIDKYLFDNSITATADPSGLRYVVTVAGTGAKPKLSSPIKVKYVGKLFDKTIFDQGTLAPSATFKCRVQDFIKGWQVGMPLLNQGSKAVFYIPSGLGYGKAGFGSSIAPNANLIFEIELIQVF